MNHLRYLVGSGLLAASLISGIVTMAFQAPAPSGGSATTDGPAKRVVKRVVLPDGAIQFEYSDGTKRRVSSKPGIPSTLTDAEEGNDTAGSGRAPDEIAPTMPPVWLKDPATNNRFLKAMGEYYDYRSSGLEHRRRVFEWQLFSSKIIFVTVLTLVGAGIVFAALQFWAGLKRAVPDARDSASEIDLSTTGVKVSSPVLGVIILVISLAFFYLYLVYVYPISELV